jgi:electron transfer flavoprotein alpha/beta subunit
MVSAELYFGRSVRGRHAVGEREWSSFVERVVAVRFPDGFTVHDGVGEWRDPATRVTVREKTKILSVLAPAAADLGQRLQSVAEEYKRNFHQQSVGIVTTEACAEF